MKIKGIIFLSLLTGGLEAADPAALNQVFTAAPNPFNYDLQVSISPGGKRDADLMVCMHGMGGDATLCSVMRANPAIPHHIMAFNFPDYGSRYTDIRQTTFGTFEEIAPALYVLKKAVVDGGADKVHVYGFSAGGGAIVNSLAALNTDRYDQALRKLGIGAAEKKKILQSIQRGSVVLEVPLKSFDEIADVFGDQEMRFLAERARGNGLTPMENIKDLHGLSLNLFVFFSLPDTALGNRDDAEFIKRFQTANENGRTKALIGKNGDHLTYHPELWEAYKKL